jgi:hypothetical protein
LIIVLMVPPVIFQLKLSMRQKLALVCIFGLGVIVCAASVSRLTTLYSSAYGSDATAGSLVSTIWTTIEAGLGVVCANLPMLRTPLQHFFPRLLRARTRTTRLSSTCTARSRPSGSSTGAILVSPVLDSARPPLPQGTQQQTGNVAHVTQCLQAPRAFDDTEVEENYWRPNMEIVSEIGDTGNSALPPRHDSRRYIPSDNLNPKEEDWYTPQHRVW